MRLLDSKTCVITGGAGSIGLASAKLFLEEGARVMLVDVREDSLRDALTSLAQTGTPPERICTRAADVSQAEEVEACFEATFARWGKIGVIFSNAGNAGAIGSITSYPEDVFDEVYRVHVKGAFLACKHGLPRMNDGGSIGIRVNTIHPGPTQNRFQAEIERSLSGVLGRDATAFLDELIPLHRHAQPEEIARAVLFLASDQSSFITGATLAVDGGMTA